MRGSGGDLPEGVRLARAVGRLLLRLYPRSFRRRFGAASRRDLDLLASDSGSGWRLLRRVVRDAARSLPREWWYAVRGGVGVRSSGGAAGLVRDPVTGRLGERLRALAQDARHGVRSLLRDRRFTGLAVLVLAVGIGVNAGVFSLVNAYLLRPLPFPESERLMAVRPVVPVMWEEADPAVLEHAVSWDLDAFTLQGPEGPELVRGAWVAPSFFEAYGIRPALGRGLGPDDTGEAGSPAVISHGLWQRRYGGADDVLGRTFTAYSSDRPDDAEIFTIVGVLSRDFWFHNRYTEIFTPLRTGNPIYMARLAPGVPVAEAEAYLTRLGRQRSAEPAADLTVSLTPFQEVYTRGVRPTLVVLSVAVGLVLLIACVNAAVLLLVRATGRQRELAIRRALGADRIRLARQLTAEGLALAAVAAVLGVALAGLGLDAGAAAIQERLGVSAPGGAAGITVDGVVIGFALLLTLGTGVVFGLIPLLGVGDRLTAPLTAGRGTDPRGHRRARQWMVAAELALSLSLLIAAGLAIASARNLAQQDLGFDPAGVVKAEVNLRERSYPEPDQRVDFFDRLTRAARAIPGVEAAGATIRVPFTWNFGGRPVESDARPVTDPATAPEATGSVIGPGYFHAMDIALRRGRDFQADDVEGAEPVAVVGETTARLLWPEGDALGGRLRPVPGLDERAHGADEPGPWYRVVGVVEDVAHGMVEDVPEFYVPYAQAAPTSMSFVMRTRPLTASPIPEFEAAVHRLDPTIAITSVIQLEDATLAARGPHAFLATVLLGFSTFALLLAVVGLYGVVSYTVSRQRREVAIRMAIGAEPRRVVRLFMLDTVPVIAAGLLTGTLGGAALARVLRSQLSGVEPVEPTLYGALAAVLAVAALAATWIPAHRAARADPAGVLREE